MFIAMPWHLVPLFVTNNRLRYSCFWCRLDELRKPTMVVLSLCYLDSRLISSQICLKHYLITMKTGPKPMLYYDWNIQCSRNETDSMRSCLMHMISDSVGCNTLVYVVHSANTHTKKLCHYLVIKRVTLVRP